MNDPDTDEGLAVLILVALILALFVVGGLVLAWLAGWS